MISTQLQLSETSNGDGARDRQVRLQPPISSKDGEHHESRISSDEREQRFRTHQDRERGMTRLPISPADVKEQRRVMSPRDREHIPSTSRLRIATDDRDLNAFPHEARGSRSSRMMKNTILQASLLIMNTDTCIGYLLTTRRKKSFSAMKQNGRNHLLSLRQDID